MDEDRRRQFRELIQTKVAADDADPGWMLAWIGLEVCDVLAEIAEHQKALRKALMGPAHREDDDGRFETDVSITDQLNRIAGAVKACAEGRTRTELIPPQPRRKP